MTNNDKKTANSQLRFLFVKAIYFAGEAVAVAWLAVAVAVLSAGADAVVVVVVSVLVSSFLPQPTKVTTATKAITSLFITDSDHWDKS